jgi:hypothetical protein
MLERGPGLVVLLTDCCSNMIAVPNPKKVLGTHANAVLHPVMRSLLFQHRGVIDITAATNDFAYGNDEIGGFFTRSLNNLFYAPMDRLDASGDSFVTWNEFFPALSNETSKTFATAMRKQGMAEADVQRKLQVPRGFELGNFGSLAGLDKRSYRGDDAKKALAWNKEYKGWLPWATYEEAGQELVLFRKVKSIASSISVDRGHNVSVAVGPEFQWKRFKR